MCASHPHAYECLLACISGCAGKPISLALDMCVVVDLTSVLFYSVCGSGPNINALSVHICV